MGPPLPHHPEPAAGVRELQAWRMGLPAHPGALGFPTADPVKPHLGLYRETIRRGGRRICSCWEACPGPRARSAGCPGPPQTSPSQEARPQTRRVFLHRTAVSTCSLGAWRPSLLWGLRTQSSTHCCVPSTWHTVGALQTLPMNGRTDGEGLMGNPGGRFRQQYPCAIMLTPSCLSDGVGHTDTPLKGG